MAATDRFDESEYMKIIDLITVTKTITLDCSTGIPLDEEELDDEDGWVYFNLDEEYILYSNMTCPHVSSMDREAKQKWLRKRFRSFVQDNGEIGMEIKSIIGLPHETDSDEEY